MLNRGIKVYEIVGSAYCVTLKDGESLHSKIADKLHQQDVVNVDFKKTEIFASPFFRSSFGPFLKEMGKEQFFDRINIKNLQESGQKLFNQIAENIERTSSDTAHQEKLNDILFEELAEI